jgi:hypothetical protein
MMRGARGKGMAKAFAATIALPLALATPVYASASGPESGPGADAAADAGPAPDYTRPTSWAVREDKGPAKADVFYIHPTTFASQAWNQRMDDTATRAWTQASVTDRQLNAFATCCRRFMPFYRQASSHAFMDRAGRGAAAYDLAYEDARRAFHVWLAQSHGRPFIIAGHSQGALLGLHLLKDEIAGKPLAKRLVAAYLPGIGIPAGALPAEVPPCTSPAQTRCLASWNGFVEGANIRAWTQRSVADYGVAGRDPAIVCINPITFDAARPAAALADGKGMLPSAQKGAPSAPMIPHAVAARCEDGVLRVDPAPGVTAPPLPNGSLHMHDIAFFWGDISANAALRVQSWQEHNR